MHKIQSNFEAIAKLINNNDIDWLHVNISRERLGKSTLSLHQMQIADKIFQKQPEVNRIIFDKEHWDSAIDATSESTIIADEPAFLLSGSDAMTKDTKGTIKDIIVSGYKHHLYILNWTDYRLIHPYIRRNRIDSIARIVKRGWAHFYSKGKVKQIKIEKDDKIKWPEPDFRDTFPQINNQLWNNYKQRKEDWRKQTNQTTQTRNKKTMTDEQMSHQIINTPELYELVISKERWGGKRRADKEIIASKYGIGETRARRVKRFTEKLIQIEEKTHPHLHDDTRE